MLRTLAINSNQIVLSFGVLIAFWSPKQSKIEESSLESLSKSRIQGVWDPAHLYPVAAIYTPATASFIPDCQKLCTSVAAIYTRLPPLPPGRITSRNLPPQMYCIRNSDAGWKRRAFQLPRSDVSGSADSAHLEDFAAILHSAAVFSWSFLICATDIFRYLSLDIFL